MVNLGNSLWQIRFRHTLQSVLHTSFRLVPSNRYVTRVDESTLLEGVVDLDTSIDGFLFGLIEFSLKNIQSLCFLSSVNFYTALLRE